MALPASLGTVTVRAKYVDLSGQPIVGRLVFAISPAALTAVPELTTIMPSPLVVDINTSTGTAQIDLPATDDPDVTPSGFTYRVTEQFTAVRGRTFDIAVPLAAAGTGLDLAAVAPVASPSAGTASAYVLTTAFDALAARVTANEARPRMVLAGSNLTTARPATTDPVVWLATGEPTNSDSTKDYLIRVEAL